MNIERLAAKGLAALASLILLVLPMAAPFAAEVYNAALEGVVRIDAYKHSHRITVRIGNRTEHLLMSRHDDFNQLSIVDHNGESIEQTGHAYIGKVEDDPSSTARLYIDGNFVQGTIISGGSPLHISSDELTTKQQLQRIGFGTSMLPPIEPKFKASTLDSAELISITVPERDNVGIETTRLARIGVVVDSLYEEAIGGRGLSKAIATINSVDAIYRENFRLGLKVDTIILITDEETLDLDETNIERNLSVFRDFRIESELLPADLAFVHLFSGIGSTEDSVGLAYRGAACRTDGYDVSMSRVFLYPVMLAAHEIGHNLGAEHDENTQDCQSVDNKLMYSVTSENTSREFSSCSNETINSRIDQATCLVAAMDIGLALTQLETNQLLISVTNLDELRAFPAAILNIELSNAAIAEAPAICDLIDTYSLTCAVPATFASETQDFRIKLRFEPNEERSVAITLNPDGFLDPNNTNNFAEIRIPAEPVTLASTNGSVTTSPSGGNSGGGGNLGFGLLTLLALLLCLSANQSTIVRLAKVKFYA